MPAITVFMTSYQYCYAAKEQGRVHLKFPFSHPRDRTKPSPTLTRKLVFGSARDGFSIRGPTAEVKASHERQRSK